MKLIHALVLVAVMPAVAMAQLTIDQKVADFENIAGLYAKRYAPYEWKRDAVGFDLLNAAPWIDKILATEDDLDFYEVLSEYISKLNDAHDVYALPANFQATLNFSVDIYDGKLLVDSINRTRLPATEFPFLVGYELVSIDLQPAKSLLQAFLRYSVAANRRSTSRLAAELLTFRFQQLMPHAADVPDISTVVFRRPDSQLETYQIPWVKSGLPLVAVGKYITPGGTTSTREFDSIVRRRFAGRRNPRIPGALDPPAKLPRSEQNGRRFWFSDADICAIAATGLRPSAGIHWGSVFFRCLRGKRIQNRIHPDTQLLTNQHRGGPHSFPKRDSLFSSQHRWARDR